jgi:Protein of unknown function (DUF4232)
MNSKRIIGAVAVIAMAAGAALIAGSLSSSTPNASAGSGGGTSGGSGTQASSGASTTSRCKTSSLEVWLGVGPGGAAAGSTYMPIEFTNTGSAPCTLYGYPGVSAWSASQLGSPASRNSQVASKTITLASGATAHAVLQITDVGNFPPSNCAPATATTLRVYPPGSFTSEDIAFRLRACSKSGPTYLSVTAVAPGVGVPGH